MVRNGAEHKWRPLFYCLQGILGFACSFCSLYCYAQIGDSKDIALHLLAASFIIMMPFLMLLKHFLVIFFLRERNSISWRVAMTIVMLVITSLTMWLSVRATPIKDGEKYAVGVASFLLASIVSIQIALVEEEFYGVFELSLTFLTIEVLSTYPNKPKFYWFVMILGSYSSKVLLMWGMKKFSRGVGASSSRLKRLEHLWTTTDRRLRDDLRLDVRRDLQSFVEMEIVINSMDSD